MNKFWAIVAVGGLALAACGDDDGSDASEASGPSVEGAWARTSPMAVDVGAAYMEILSPADDQLVAATVSSDVAGEVQIHEVALADMTAGSMPDMTGDMDGDVSGPTTMQQIAALDLPAGVRVVLEPGGYHLMLMGLTEPLEAGQSFELTLDFAEADDTTITVDVRDDAP